MEFEIWLDDVLFFVLSLEEATMVRATMPELPSTCICRLQKQLGTATSAVNSGRWKQAQNPLDEIQKVAEFRMKQLKDRTNELCKIPGCRCAWVKVLIETGRLWNRLLRVDKSETCFALVKYLETSVSRANFHISSQCCHSPTDCSPCLVCKDSDPPVVISDGQHLDRTSSMK